MISFDYRFDSDQVLGPKVVSAEFGLDQLRETGSDGAGRSLSQWRARLPPGNGFSAFVPVKWAIVCARLRVETGTPIRRPRGRTREIAARFLGAQGRNENQRDVGCLVVETESVTKLVVLAEVLAVVGRDHNPGVRELARLRSPVRRRPTSASISCMHSS